MPLSKSQRRQIYSTLSSIVEHSFLDDGDAADDSTQRQKRVVASHTHVLVHKRHDCLVDDASPKETTHHHRHIQSFIVVYTMIFFNGCCFTAVVPSVPFYLKLLAAPPSFLGLVVSVYSLGQICGSTVLASWLNDKLDSKTLLMLTSTMGLVSSTFYVIAPNHWYVLFSRFLTGVSAGWEFTTELAFIARNTSFKERTVFLASVTAVNVVGFVIGPGLSTLLSMLKFTVMGLEINEYTGPGWLLVLMFLIDLMMVRTFFCESSPSCPSESKTLLQDEKEEIGYGATDKEVDLESQVTAEKEQRLPSLIVIVSLNFLQFTLMSAWSVLETITSPLAGDSFGWHISECNILFTCGGAASLVAYVSFVVASKWIEDRLLIAYALITCFVGLMLMITWSSLIIFPPYLWRFIAGYLIMNAGFMTGRPVTFALYSKLIPEKHQGSYLGLMVGSGSAARTLGPFVAVYCYYHIEKGGNVLFGSIAAIMITCLAVMSMLWPSLVPESSGKEKSISVKKSSDGVVLSHHSDGLSMHVDKGSNNLQ